MISAGFCRAVRLLPGIALAVLVALPWYVLELLVEGQPFWDSFFGYHNLQRYTAVVNNHAGPWWFYAPVMVIASVPFTPLLLLGVGSQLKGCWWRRPLKPDQSLPRFALAWLLFVVLFFSVSATKLPSYMLPALPAAALLIALADAPGRWLTWARWASVLMAAVMAAAFWIAAPLVVQIDSPEIPGLGPALEASGVLVISGGLFALAAVAGAALLLRRSGRWPGSWLLALQLPLVAWQVLALVPTGELVDQRRQQPVRQLAQQVRLQAAARRAAGDGGGE